MGLQDLHTFDFVLLLAIDHYETRTRTVSDGNGGTRTETYQAKVVTWRATDHIVYSSWMDRSTQVTGTCFGAASECGHNVSLAVGSTQLHLLDSRSSKRQVDENEARKEA